MSASSSSAVAGAAGGSGVRSSAGNDRALELIGMKHADGTKGTYGGKIRLLCEFLLKNGEDGGAGPQFVNILDRPKRLYELIVPRKKKSKTNEDLLSSQVNYDARCVLFTSTIVSVIGTICGPAGSKQKRKSTIGGYRSAIGGIFNAAEEDDDHYQAEWKSSGVYVVYLSTTSG